MLVLLLVELLVLRLLIVVLMVVCWLFVVEGNVMLVLLV